ncbi:hypothetical protein [Geobacter sp. DSM 9736]|uniref:hypothetical protein n=1 Tax=Geobacter sp. DSM 9736 TaxID=1277350 RepID=UPI000B5147E3|nr:hypothetical protein [Geobacter sp. DSM 9736]SNB48109.1 hypothetical protein SAMN06269301_3605 [Geobacter sp. DSM 9736]
MIRERNYSITNKCLNRIKTSGLDQMLKVRLECNFIRLKRHILSTHMNLVPEDLALIEQLSEQIVQTADKGAVVERLEQKIREVIGSADF